MLHLDNLSVSYGAKNIISGLSYDFNEEAVYAVVGKSGSGKRSSRHFEAGGSFLAD